MNTYQIPRNYKGESRILYVFSIKALIASAIGAFIGLPFYFIFNMFGMTLVGIIVTLCFGAIGYSIATFKVPETKAFDITKKTGGEKIDDIILRWFKFKMKKNVIYVQKEFKTEIAEEK